MESTFNFTGVANKEDLVGCAPQGMKLKDGKVVGNRNVCAMCHRLKMKRQRSKTKEGLGEILNVES